MKKEMKIKRYIVTLKVKSAQMCGSHLVDKIQFVPTVHEAVKIFLGDLIFAHAHLPIIG